MAKHSQEEGRSAVAASAAASVRNGLKRCHLLHSVDSSDVNMSKNKPSTIHGSLSTTGFILSKVFRKDGPPLGSEFDSLPSEPLICLGGSSNTCSSPQENHRALKKRKVAKLSYMETTTSEGRGASVKKHGIGKGLMTLWNALHPDGRNSLPRFKCLHDISNLSKPGICDRKKQLKRLGDKVNGKKKPQARTKKEKKKKECKSQFAGTEQCGLAIVGGGACTQEFDLYSELEDDQELELREVQDSDVSLSCPTCVSATFPHYCRLCKDLVGKFPPDSVKMKLPVSMQPWASSKKLVKKLFKAFHFLYTCSSVLSLFPFTLDDFVEAFHVKDSMLLGQIHMTLLKYILTCMEMELSGGGCLSHMVRNVMFFGCLPRIQRKEFVVKLWIKGLNSLTWVEIMRQILVAAGFGARDDTLEKQIHNKEVDIMVKYGLRPGTLKFKIFSVLMEYGNKGLDVYQLEKILQDDDSALSGASSELGRSISSTLASDITLFEKISSSAYRLRVATETFSDGYLPCDSDEPETVDYDEGDDHRVCHSSPGANVFPPCNEIDESPSGEGWLVGVTEGEYSDLSVEEKLDALSALVDIISSQFTAKESVNSMVPIGRSKDHHGFREKVNHSSVEVLHGNQSRADASMLFEFQSMDSSVLASQFDETSSIFGENGDHNPPKVGPCSHPMQSVFLGFDRRYNKYWLFLGICDPSDPGHRQIYFQSSEDGHWEVIDCKESLRCLLSVLDCKGRREARLRESLLNIESFMSRAMSVETSSNGDAGSDMTEHRRSEDVIDREKSASPVSDVDKNQCSGNELQVSSVMAHGVQRKVVAGGEDEWNRSQEFDAWIWSSFYCNLSVVKRGKRPYLDSLMRCGSCRDLYWRDERHCRTCHSTFEVDFDLEERYTVHAATCRLGNDAGVFPNHKVFPSHLQSLKAAVYGIESVIPKEAMTSSWTRSSHNLWIKRLRRTASIYELFQVLTDFVTAIDLEWLDRSNVMVGSGCIVDEIISCFFTMPRTSSSVALWLVKLDNLIDPYLAPPPPTR